jgi:hypothetical protein
MGSPGQEEGQKKKAEALEEKKPQGVDPEAPPPQPRVSLGVQKGPEKPLQPIALCAHKALPRGSRLYHPMLACASMGAPAKGSWGSYQAWWTEGNRKQGY